VTLIAGERRLPLQVSDNGWSYLTPVGDQNYPDETLIEIRFAKDSIAR
jgi:hypothetical protein